MNNYYAKCYQRTEIATADQKRLILMCYEGAIERIQKAKEEMFNKNYEEKTKNLSKAREIITELQCALDFEKGGQIAKNLDAIYSYILNRIFEGDCRNDIAAIEETLTILKGLKGAWETIFKKKQNWIPDAIEYENEKAMGHISV